MAKEVLLHPGVANSTDYKLGEDEYGGDDVEIRAKLGALRRYEALINMYSSSVTYEKYILFEDALSKLTGRRDYRGREAKRMPPKIWHKAQNQLKRSK